MKTPRYLLAKYIPDLHRMEPRNVGVVVWSPDGVAARFLAEKADQPAVIDGRSVPSFVASPSAYRQWVEFWRRELERPEVDKPDGTRVPQGSPAFLETIQLWNRGNFVLVDGGMLLDPVDSDELPDLVNRLYGALVETTRTDDQRDPTLDELCDNLIEETRLASDPHFVNRFSVQCAVAADTTETFEFSHAYKNGSLWRLYQRVPLPQRRRLLRKTVHDSAWMFEKVVQASIISRDHTAALVYVSDDQTTDPAIDESLRVLHSVTRVLNLQDREAVREEFAGLAAATVSP